INNMSFERSYSIESHERIKLILIFGDKSLLLIWWVTYIYIYISSFHQYSYLYLMTKAGSDMVDHEILYQHLQLSYSISNIPLLWLKSYLSDRSKMVDLGDFRSK